MQKKLKSQYQKYTHVEHVLKLPDTYVGSIENHEDNIYVFNSSINKNVPHSGGDDADTYNDNIQKQKITYIPALYKIVDEIIVNAIDQYTRLQTTSSKKLQKYVTKIEINVDEESGIIEVINNGEGIDIVMMEEHNMYPPELIFGCLLTSSNYDETEKKVTGGKNGYGAKLTNIFSKRFVVETVDHKRKLKYLQVFEKNMSQKNKPEIVKYTKEPFTRIQFLPDYKRFNLTNINKDTFLLLKKRAWDVAAWVGDTVKVFFNGTEILTNTFKEYTSMYLGNFKERIYEKCNKYWEIVATYNQDETFEQVSFVNGINTIRGGKHVEYIVDQIKDKLVEFIKKKYKKIIKPIYVRNQLMVFVKSSIIKL